MEEPSVLDYLKEKLNPKNWGKHVEGLESIPEANGVEETPPQAPAAEIEPVAAKVDLPWRSLLALFFALVAQRLLEPSTASVGAALLLYAASLGLILMAVLRHEWAIQSMRLDSTAAMAAGVRKVAFFIFLPVVLIAFLSLSQNRFTGVNVFLWLVAVILAVYAFWQPAEELDLRKGWQKFWNFIRHPFVNIQLTGWGFLVAASFALAAFFHLDKLSSIPLDMTSDHAEKLLDINDVLNGKFSIFFTRNSGREPIQFYLSTILIKWFGAGLNFTTLKLSMALAFLAGLYFVYRLGKELGNRWTGLLAMLFVGFASWTEIISRVGLRLVLYPVFVAPVLYFMLRGFRRSNRNDFILAGIFMGLGLMGYTAFRIMPVVVFLGVLLYILFQRLGQKRKEAWLALGIMALFTFVLALPLIRYAIEYPEVIGYRTLTRMTSAEVPLAADVIKVFFSNTWNALTMPFWNDGSTWFISVTNRPALDVVSAALLFIGLVTIIVRWFKQRDWQDLFLLLSIPVLMLPSILALAFPIENPSLSRAGGAIIPIVIIIAIGLQSVLTSLWQRGLALFGKILVVVLALGLVVVSAAQNYDLFFNQFNTSYADATWNTQQIGDVCKDYIDSVGAPDTCYVVGLAYWVDTRLVAMVAGYPTMDYALWPNDIPATKADPRAKMFIVRADQADEITQLVQLFPNGFETLHHSTVPGRDFIAYLVPPAAVGQ